ncbi:hypothetical protein NLX78_10030 [Paenibacillus sp. Lou8.1]|nr:hypothetical protein [Paenibacillus sp. Lou8.1]MCP3807568.1 hypothetical protein [Paenibacillus sp. Lou8.1]
MGKIISNQKLKQDKQAVFYLLPAILEEVKEAAFFVCHQLPYTMNA